jgi:anti-sigma B factor antagonist
MEELGPLTPASATVEVTSAPDGTAIVRVGGELDMSSVDHLEAEVEPVLAPPPPRLVVDVSNVSFADSSAIAMWVRWAGAVPSFELRDPPPLLRRVLRTMGLDARLGVTS